MIFALLAIGVVLIFVGAVVLVRKLRLAGQGHAGAGPEPGQGPAGQIDQALTSI
jgi:hypothetical protein